MMTLKLLLEGVSYHHGNMHIQKVYLHRKSTRSTCTSRKSTFYGNKHSDSIVRKFNVHMLCEQSYDIMYCVY